MPSRDELLAKKIAELQENLEKRKQLKDIDEDEMKKLEKEISELEDLRDRVIKKKALHGVYGESVISDINDSAAIPVASINPDAPVYDGDDLSPVIDPNLSEEERRIEFLCGGIPLDESVSYEKSKNPTRIRLHYIPINEKNGVRQGKKLIGGAKRIVAHETRLGLGYISPDRNLEYYERSMDLNDANGKEVGYHFLCDADEIICFIPWDEVAFHASSRFYNYRSIGIERIVTEQAGTASLYNQAKLIATLMYLNNIPISKVITHFDATNTRRFPLRDAEGNVKRDENGEVMFIAKSCPDRLINGEYGGLLAFRQVIVNCLRTGDLFVKELEEIREQYASMDEDGSKQASRGR